MAEISNSKEGGQSPPSFFHSHLWGIFLFVIACASISMTNVCAKWASSEHHVLDILFYRNFVALLIAAIYIRCTTGFSILKTQRPKDHIKRGIVGTVGVGSAFAAFALLPIADATVLLFTIPIFTALLSMPLLGEKVGPLRWGAIIVGFAGIAIAAQPSGDFSWIGVGFALLSALTSAMVGLFLRDLGKSEPPIRTVFYFLLIGTIITGICLPFVGHVPSWEMLPILCLAGILGFSNQSLKTKAYTIVPTALLSPFLYTMLIWAVIMDFLIWDKLPTSTVLIGGTIIISSNLFLLWRERKKSKDVKEAPIT